MNEHDMPCMCDFCIKAKGGAPDTSKGSSGRLPAALTPFAPKPRLTQRLMSALRQLGHRKNAKGRGDNYMSKQHGEPCLGCTIWVTFSWTVVIGCLIGMATL